MKRIVAISFLIIIGLFVGLSANAQNDTRFNGQFNAMPFEQFIRTVEANSDLRFYYDPAQTDSVVITVNAKELTIQELLAEAFRNTGLYFSIDDKKVFITRGAPLSTGISSNFFDTVTTQRPADPVVSTTDQRPERIRSAAENRLYEIGNRSSARAGKQIITGFVKDAKNGEPLIGASLYIDSLQTGVTTDQFGYYSISVPAGRHVLQISSLGMKETRRNLQVYSDGSLNIELHDDVPSLKSVTVYAGRRNNIRSLQMGVERLTIRTIKQVLVVFGEPDILRVVLALPGVTSVGEASTGFNVRGGSTDQNLILFNDATVYNPSHLFGFFTAFNPDAVKGVELYKSGIPVKYGGRLSSVLDVTTKDGNDKKISGTGGIGLLTSKFTLEGPIKKEKTTFILGGRTTYSNWLLKAVPDDAYKNSSASFYDVNMHITHKFDQKNDLYLTAYKSNDQFRLNSDTTYKYGNENIVLKWKHIFNNKFFGVFTAGIDDYDHSISSAPDQLNAFRLAFKINQKHVRSDLNFTPNNTHSFNFGVNAIRYTLKPGSMSPLGSGSLVTPKLLQTEHAVESAVYFADQFTVSPKLSLNLGLRYSMFNYLGAHDIYKYAANVPREVSSMTDTTSYGKGKLINTYHGPELRFSMRYSLADDASLKFSVNTMRQYIHMLSNTVAIAPTDIWKLSDPYIRPQLGEQVSIGFYKNFRSNLIETSLEVYYKRLRNFMDYKSGADLLLNDHIETDVVNSRGRAYGAELMVRKTTGKINGWISYTFSRTQLQSDDPLADKVNKGNYYPASFDKPHNVNVVSNYKINHRVNISFNLVYSSGRPITLPIAVFTGGGAQRLLYSDRNQYRIPDYFRTDLSVNIDGNHKVNQFAHNSWSFGVYNMFARKNAYSVYFVQESGSVKGYQLSVFGTAIPFITYNFRF